MVSTAEIGSANLGIQKHNYVGLDCPAQDEIATSLTHQDGIPNLTKCEIKQNENHQAPASIAVETIGMISFQIDQEVCLRIMIMTTITAKSMITTSMMLVIISIPRIQTSATLIPSVLVLLFKKNINNNIYTDQRSF